MRRSGLQIHTHHGKQVLNTQYRVSLRNPTVLFLTGVQWAHFWVSWDLDSSKYKMQKYWLHYRFIGKKEAKDKDAVKLKYLWKNNSCQQCIFFSILSQPKADSLGEQHRCMECLLYTKCWAKLLTSLYLIIMMTHEVNVIVIPIACKKEKTEA